MKVENNELHLFDPNMTYGINSSLFWGQKWTLDLSLNDENETDIIGWKTTMGFCECDRDGYDPLLELFGVQYENVNISIRNAVMAVDGPGTTFMYSSDHGMIRSSHYSWWLQSGYGWDLLGE